MSTELPPETYTRLLHLNAAYALGVDTGDAETVAACFAADAQLKVGGELAETGAEQIAARLTGRSTPGVLHTSTGLVARSRADGAVQVTSYFFMFDTRAGQLTAAGRYEDVAAVDDEGVRWVSRDVHYQWRAGALG